MCMQPKHTHNMCMQPKHRLGGHVQRVISGYYVKPTNYTSIGVSVGGGHEAY